MIGDGCKPYDIVQARAMGKVVDWTSRVSDKAKPFLSALNYNAGRNVNMP